jgi:predicted ATPase
MQTLDLIHLDGNSGEYAFKHALVRDALYQSLLTEPRRALHTKIAKEIEHRSGNRLIEVVETLAYHYSESDHSEKAFAYLSMAGSKSLSVYSLDEAASHFAAALSLLDKNAGCASDDQVADFLDPYLRLLNLSAQINVAIDVAQRYLARIVRLGDDSRVILIRCHYVFSLIFNRRHQEAAAIQRDNLPMAERLGDSRSKAYALAHEILVSIDGVPKSLQEFERLKIEALRFASNTNDVYIQMQTTLDNFLGRTSPRAHEPCTRFCPGAYEAWPAFE